jgi:hypothetical protein
VARLLVDRGYPAGSAVRYASDHHRLPEEKRMLLRRVVISAKTALFRMAKARNHSDLFGKSVFLDGYNTIITVESLLAGYPVYLCDDGFVRDTRGLFRRYRAGPVTFSAIDEILGLLCEAGPSRVEVLLDSQISRSGGLAGELRRLMAERHLPGDAQCVRDVDHQLKICGGVVASTDGNVIDCAIEAIDLPAEIARRRGLIPRIV